MAAIALRRGLDAYTRMSNARPWSVAFGTCWVKGCIADAVSQLVVERGQHPEGFDTRRNLVFGAYGGWYCGLVQHGIYNHLYTRLLGSSTSIVNALRKVALDSVVHVPFVVFPVYYAYKHTFYDGDGASAGLRLYASEAVDMCQKCDSATAPAVAGQRHARKREMGTPKRRLGAQGSRA